MTQPKITDETAHKIRYMYLHHRKQVAANRDGRYEHNRRRAEFSAGKAEGIFDTLNFLGIEIDMINGGEAE